MKLVVLTGSIGMGKTETLKMFKKRGVPVFDSDEVVHELYDVGGKGTEFIKKHFPQAIKGGRVDRSLLSKIVMNDETAIKKIETTIHPLVQKKQQEFIDQNITAPILIFDIPLFFESKQTKEFDKVIVVSAPEEVQKNRVLKRQGMTLKKLDKILSLQMPDSEKRAKADFIIETDKGFDHAENRVDEIMRKLAS